MGGNARGAAGEAYAARALEAMGYTVAARNVHSRYGEVDIVAVADGVISFVEVKTRRPGALVSGAQAVGRQKQRKIIATALWFLQAHPEYAALQPRFDLMEVEWAGGAPGAYDFLTGVFDGEAYQRRPFPD